MWSVASPLTVPPQWIACPLYEIDMEKFGIWTEEQRLARESLGAAGWIKVEPLSKIKNGSQPVALKQQFLFF